MDEVPRAAFGGSVARPGEIGRRIVVYGPSGSGKTTLAGELARRLGLPHVELDAVFHHRPNWEDRTSEDFRAQVQSLLATHAGGWVFDGNYSVVRDLILPQADTAVWLRLPFRVVYPRLVGRTIRRAVRNAPLWNGNRETLRQAFLSRESMLLWGITAWRRGRRGTAAALANAPRSASVFVLESARDVEAFLGGVRDRDVRS